MESMRVLNDREVECVAGGYSDTSDAFIHGSAADQLQQQKMEEYWAGKIQNSDLQDAAYLCLAVPGIQVKIESPADASRKVEIKIGDSSASGSGKGSTGGSINIVCPK